MVAQQIEWPDGHHPDDAGVYVSNNLVMEASAEEVWNCLVRAKEWPEWYPNSANVQFLNSESESLELGTVFRWKTFGATITCKVREFVPGERLAWSSQSTGMSVYHAWQITPSDPGCHVLTEETQNGFIPKIASMLMPGRMHKFHQIWLEQLNKQAQMHREQ